jgi:hypothetical protein
VIHLNKRLPQRKHQSLARDPWSCSGLTCALNTGSRHSACCLAAKNDRKPIVVTRSPVAWPFVQRVYSLSLAMGLTTILTLTFVHGNAPKSRILISKENWTSGDVRGHAADVWGSRARGFKPVRHGIR